MPFLYKPLNVLNITFTTHTNSTLLHYCNHAHPINMINVGPYRIGTNLVIERDDINIGSLQDRMYEKCDLGQNAPLPRIIV